jgi:hypothetical protein
MMLIALIEHSGNPFGRPTYTIVGDLSQKTPYVTLIVLVYLLGNPSSGSMGPIEATRNMTMDTKIT